VRNLTHEAIGATATWQVCAAIDSGAAVATGTSCASLLGTLDQVLTALDEPSVRKMGGDGLPDDGR
jgi:hypothetical protein